MLSAPKFQRDGTALFVDDGGNAGLPVFFQHGLCGDAAQTADVFSRDGRFRRITLECRGHGHSQAGNAEAFSIAAFTDDLAALIEARSSGPAIVGGISMGAAIALRLAVTRKDLVRGLVLARPAWVADAAPENMRPNADVGALLARLPAAEAQAMFAASDAARQLAQQAPDNLASLNGFFSRAPQAVTAALLQRISADGPGVQEADIAALHVPTLVIGHERDVIHPLGMAERLAALIPGARLCVITPKADDRTRYRAEFSAALSTFLEDFI